MLHDRAHADILDDICGISVYRDIFLLPLPVVKFQCRPTLQRSQLSSLFRQFLH